VKNLPLSQKAADFGFYRPEGRFAFEMRCNYAAAVDEERNGQAENSSVLRAQLFVAHQDREWHRTALQEVSDGLGVIVHGHGNDLKAADAVYLLPLRKAGQFNLAGPAPRCPEVKQDDLSFERSQIDAVLRKIVAGELGRRVM
jgi:hypothetical protein